MYLSLPELSALPHHALFHAVYISFVIDLWFLE
jgi:hypothetical protein